MGPCYLSNIDIDSEADPIHKFHPQSAQPMPRGNLHIAAARAQVLATGAVLWWHGAAHPVGPRTFPGGGEVQRGFKGGPQSPDADLHPPDFRRLRGQELLRGLVFWKVPDVTRAAAPAGCGNRGTWPKLPYRPETLC